MSTKKNALTPFTFKDTGIPILIKKVSPLLIMELRKKNPEPKPPTQEVVINGKKVIESNAAHPEYKAAKEQYELGFETKIRKMLIERGVDLNLTDEQKEEVRELREYWKEENGEDLPGTDKFIYVSYIAIGTDEDMEDLLAVITQRSQPSNGAVEAALETFPGEV